VSWRRLGVASLEALVGAGGFYGAANSEAVAMKDEQVVVVGGGSSAGQATLHLASYAAQVTMLVRGPTLAETKRVAGAVGDGAVAIRLVHEYLSHQG
jgi:thioredoxin reductase (NADPH)